VKASLIVPCWNSARTLPRFLEGVRAQTCSDFEVIFIDDGSTDATSKLLEEAATGGTPVVPVGGTKVGATGGTPVVPVVGTKVCFRVIHQANAGVSAARNAGLKVAKGEFVFFADPDDLIYPDMLSKGIEAMERDGADYCVFPYYERYEDEPESHLVPLQGSCRYSSNAEIVERHLPRMFGYSFEQVREWYAGVPLSAHRVQGGVCWCGYRREVIEQHHIRFDERIALYEDAMFNCAYMLRASRMTCVEEPLYEYLHERTGAIARLRRNGRELANKLELLRVRKELDAIADGKLAPQYAASCVFSVLEMLQIILTFRAPFGSGMRMVCAYLADPVVRRAFAGFPLSWRHPLLALGVLVLRRVAPVQIGQD